MRRRPLRWPLLPVAGMLAIGCVHHAVPDACYPSPQIFSRPCPSPTSPIINANDSNPKVSKQAPLETMPIDFTTALRLADEKNPTIAIAREKIQEALAREEAAEALWLPNLEAGP